MRVWIGVMFAVLAALCASAQDYGDNVELKVRAYEGYTRFVDEYGDTCRMTYIKNITVYPPMKFKNKKEEEFYWRTVRDVKKTLPYAKLAFSTLCETYEYIQTIPDKKTRERHLKTLEKDIFQQYKPVVKRMTKGQGKVMPAHKPRDGPDVVQYREGFPRKFPSRILADVRPFLRPEHEVGLQPEEEP